MIYGATVKVKVKVNVGLCFQNRCSFDQAIANIKRCSFLPYMVHSGVHIAYTCLRAHSESCARCVQRGGVFVYVAVYNVGTPAPDACGQTVNSLASGVLLSPTYPGMYPDHIFCFYKIHGAAGQRVRLVFTEIDLYLGGDQ